MDYFVICITALFGSILTLFSGFGLGTILLPVFGFFFPIEIAIVMTSIVHFANNLLKLLFFGKNANKNIVLKFGLPAIIAAFVGAYILNLMSGLQTLLWYEIFGKTFEITILKIVIGLLLVVFALFDFIPKLKNLEFDAKYLPFGGVLSGFFGGISGHQGALRSAFLIRTDLNKEAFIATGVMIACLVDVSRLCIYIPKIINNGVALNYQLLTTAVLSAFLGVYFGSKLLQKTTVGLLQNIVCFLLIVFGLLMMLGII